MKLNRVEKALMNNPVRSALQWHYEARLLERLGGRVDGMRVLEIGWGRGVSAEIIVRRLGSLNGWLYRTFLEHPTHNRFSASNYWRRSNDKVLR